MIRMLIVDDEPLMRFGIQNVVPWLEHGYQIVGTAKDGADAVAKAAALRPDVVMMDLLMPGMGGFDAIERIRDALPACQFVILSCVHDEPSHRAAAELGVAGYIGKSSFEPSELLALMKRISTGIQSSAAQGQQPCDALAGWAQDALDGRTGDDPLQARMLALGIDPLAPWQLMRFASSPDELDLDAALQLAQQIIDDTSEGFAFAGPQGSACCLIALQDQAAGPFIARVQKTMRQYLDAAVTGSAQPIRSLKPAALRAAYAALIAEHSPSAEGCAQHRTRELARALGNLRFDEPFDAAALTAELGDAMQNARYSIGAAKSDALDVIFRLQWRLESMDMSLGDDFKPVLYLEGAQDIDALMDRLAGHLVQIRDHYNQQSRDYQLILRIKTYIADHLGERISLEDIADHTHYSQAYIGRVFKSSGQNIHSYIQRMRIEAAQNLLLQGANIKHIAGALGFSSESHFIRTFRAVTGTTPGKFARRTGRATT